MTSGWCYSLGDFKETNAHAWKFKFQYLRRKQHRVARIWFINLWFELGTEIQSQVTHRLFDDTEIYLYAIEIHASEEKVFWCSKLTY